MVKFNVMFNKLIFTIIFFQISYSQFSTVDIDLDVRQIRENDKYILDGFKEKVKSYPLRRVYLFELPYEHQEIADKRRAIISTAQKKSSSTTLTSNTPV